MTDINGLQILICPLRQNNNCQAEDKKAKESVSSQLFLVRCDLDSLLSVTLIMACAAHFLYVQVATHSDTGDDNGFDKKHAG